MLFRKASTIASLISAEASPKSFTEVHGFTRISIDESAKVPTTTTGGSSDSGPAIAVLSGVKRVSPAETFRNLDVTLFMGGAQLDYRAAVLPAGQEAVIDMLAVMGGCEIFVPPHWVVSAPVTTVLGGIDDRRVAQAPPIVDHADASAGPPPRLVLRGLVLMGGVTIRS